MNNYKLLPALVAILQTRNLTESAKQLNVTQSAMSKTLNQIRDAFHDKIVIRQANYYVLTRKGEELKSQLPALMAQLDSLYLPQQVSPQTCKRIFHLSSSDYVAQAVLPRICCALAEQAPHASISYQMWQKEKLADIPETGLDLVSTITSSVPDNLHGSIMAEDQLVVVSRRHHKLCKQTLDLERYLAGKHILISGGGDKDSPVDKALAEQGVQRDVMTTVPFFQAAIELLMKTDAMLTTPLHIAADFAQSYDLQIHALPLNLPAHQYYLLWHAKYQQDPEHRWFRELCLPIFKSHLAHTIEQGMKLLHGVK